MSNNLAYGLIFIIAGILLFGAGTVKLLMDKEKKSQHRKLWRIKGQMGGVIFIIVGILLALGIIGKLISM